MKPYEVKRHKCETLCIVAHPPYLVIEPGTKKIKARFQHRANAVTYAEILEKESTMKESDQSCLRDRLPALRLRQAMLSNTEKCEKVRKSPDAKGLYFFPLGCDQAVYIRYASS